MQDYLVKVNPFGDMDIINFSRYVAELGYKNEFHLHRDVDTGTLKTEKPIDEKDLERIESIKGITIVEI